MDTWRLSSPGRDSPGTAGFAAMPLSPEKLKELEEKQALFGKKLREAKRLADGGGNYDHHRKAAAARSRKKSESGRDIGPLPPVQDPNRKERCKHDLELFGLTYFPHRFKLALATFHRKAIAILQSATHEGGLSVCAMPRGSGKDTWAEVEVLRAILYGWRHFVVLVSATEQHAKRSLKKLKKELESNPLLLADFPEACYPISKLDRINHRARGQTLNGLHTQMEWTDTTITLPTVEGSQCSGSTIYVAGITGAIRGPSILGPDGEPLRPDMVIINDAQTRESAKSPTMTAEREAIVSDDILMLAGPTVEIAATMLCTVIYRNDLSDRFLSPDKHPEWQSVRTKMLDAFPKNRELWDQYAEHRRDGLRDGDKGKKGNAFYTANREKMDIGGVATWPERKKGNELSGLQSAMNLFIDNPRGFFAEAQNDPLAAEVERGAKELSAISVAARLSGTERTMIPQMSTRLTCFVDCSIHVLWYGVVAWTESFGGTVVDYGCWPRQNRTIFAENDARPSLRDQFRDRPAITSEAQLLYAGIEGLTAEVLAKTYYRIGGGEMRIEMCLIDSGWQTKAVYEFIQRSGGRFGCPIHPSKGIGRTIRSLGVSEWKPRQGERSGHHWRLTSGEYGTTRSVQFDTDTWKSFIHSALTVAPGGPTGLWLFGKSAITHEMIGEHCAAEYAIPATVRGTTFDKWDERPDRRDNHLFDVLVGAAVGASVLGVKWSATPEGKPEVKPAQKLETWSEMARRKREERERRNPDWY